MWEGKFSSWARWSNTNIMSAFLKGGNFGKDRDAILGLSEHFPNSPVLMSERQCIESSPNDPTMNSCVQESSSISVLSALTAPHQSFGCPFTDGWFDR